MKLYQPVYKTEYGTMYIDAWYRTKKAATNAFKINTADFDTISTTYLGNYKFFLREIEVSLWRWLFK